MKVSSLMSAVVLSFVLTGCAHTVKVADYKEAEIDSKMCDIKPPDYIVNKTKIKATVLPFGDTGELKGEFAKFGQEVMSQLLSSKCGVEVVERSQLNSVVNEVKLSGEFDLFKNNEQLSSLGKDIDYYILGVVSRPVFKADFTPSTTSRDKKGNVYVSKPMCSVSASVTTNIRLIKSTTGSIYKAFDPFSGKVSSAFEVQSKSECKIGDSTSMIQSALSNSITNNDETIIDAFPSYGYISKTMTKKDDNKNRIAFVNLGTSDGLRAGDKVEIIKFEKRVDRIKNSESIEPVTVTEAKVAESELRDNSAVITIPEEASNDVLSGYAVKTKASKSIFKAINRFTSSY